MLRSMTGQGQAQLDSSLGAFTAELRTVNNRGFKLVAKLGELLGSFESRVESLVRTSVTRGTVQLSVYWRFHGSSGSARINTRVVASYFRQLEVLREELGTDAPIDLARLASLPGGIEESASLDEDEEVVWEQLQAVVLAALENLDSMRLAEGGAMERQLLADIEQFRQHVDAVQVRAPLVQQGYRDRLRAKVEDFLGREGIQVEPPELLREVQIFADRSDISEEITRLRSHLDLFSETIADQQASGRKLDFVIQEMFRETNTIGSKAGDAEIARHVVEMKCGLERMRELVQNVE